MTFDTDQQIINRLKIGMNQRDISTDFKKKGISPNSLSIIEKRLRTIKNNHHARTLFHLAVILKNKGII